MPIYEFTCDECGSDFEKLVPSMNYKGAPECPKCQSKNTHKRMSVFSARAAEKTSQPFEGGCGMGPDGRCGRGGCQFS